MIGRTEVHFLGRTKAHLLEGEGDETASSPRDDERNVPIPPPRGRNGIGPGVGGGGLGFVVLLVVDRRPRWADYSLLRLSRRRQSWGFQSR